MLVADSQSQSADAGQLGVDRFERKLDSLWSVLGKVTFKSNTLQHCVTP